jgi:hypothetical protein
LATINAQGSWVAKGVHQTQWPNMGNADTGTAQSAGALSDKSVQVEGTFAAATVTIQGSNDGVNWETLRDPAGVALTFTAVGQKQILENTRYQRPVTTGGAGSTITVTIVERSGALT